MKPYKIFVIIIAVMVVAMDYPYAQNGYESVLNQIESHNRQLQALQKNLEAEKMNNTIGLFNNGPEIGFNYLWGNTIAGSNRIDFSATQSFDLPWVYVYKRQIAKLKDTNSEWSFQIARQAVLYEAKRNCVQLIFNNVRVLQCRARLENASQIAIAYQKKLDNGDANILDIGKANINLKMAQNDLSMLLMERDRLLGELKQLNGGTEIALPEDSFSLTDLPADFETWYAFVEKQNPMLAYVKGKVSMSEKDVQLVKASNAPKFFAGYMNESVIGADCFQGITAGITVPLWENKKRVLLAKTQLQANQVVLEDAKCQLYNDLKSRFMRAVKLKTAIMQYRELVSSDVTVLLKKALDAGEISLLQYLQEIQYYYDVHDKLIEAERDYELCVAELTSSLL